MRNTAVRSRSGMSGAAAAASAVPRPTVEQQYFVARFDQTRPWFRSSRLPVQPMTQPSNRAKNNVRAGTPIESRRPGRL